MRILHTVESYAPEVGGMAEVVRQLSERLAAHGHDVTVATRTVPGRTATQTGKVKVAEFAVSGNLATGLCGEVDAYRAFLRAGQYDIVTAFAAQQWATDILLPLLGELPAKKVFVPTGFSGLGQPAYSDYFSRMPQWLVEFDRVVFCATNYRDAAFARRHGITDTMVIPNGAAADEFLADTPADSRLRLGIPHNHFLVLHVGAHTGLKGHPEVMEIFARADLREATLLMIGNVAGSCLRDCQARAGRHNRSRAFRRTDRNIILADMSRAETVAAFKSADLFLFPSAIECSPIVLFESLAAHTLFLSTDVGNAREIVEWSGGGMILPTRRNHALNNPGEGLRNRCRALLEGLGAKPPFSPAGSYARAEVKASAKMLADLWRNPSLRLEMAERGFAVWGERFTWERITRDYEALYQTLVHEAHA